MCVPGPGGWRVSGPSLYPLIGKIHGALRIECEELAGVSQPTVRSLHQLEVACVLVVRV